VPQLSLLAGINPRDTGLIPLNFAELFGNDNPVVLEIGSGKGRFLISSATAFPNRNFVGIEKSLHYFRVILGRLQKRELPNACIINFDAFPVLERMVPDESLEEIHVYFPDPWPRKREQKRRMMRPEVLRQMERVMKRDGTGIYVTDHKEYFEAALPALESMFETKAGEVEADRAPRTNYEAKYRAEGRPIFEAIFRRR
jgi:tRNA (guanine-N7-)-methyltransferase